MNIHSTSIIDKSVKIPQNTTIGPYSIIESDVSIGESVKIASNVLIKSGTIIGNNVEIFSGAIIGEKPQDLKYNNEKTIVKIGDNSIIREYVTIHKGTKDRKITKIGSNCLLMAYSHVAHDTFLGNNVILSNDVQVGGHVTIENNVIIGGSTPIHQFCKIGEYAFVGGGYRIVQDVPPYIKAMGEPLKYFGINSVGLKRNSFSEDIISTIKKAYRVIYRSEHNILQAIKILDENSNSKLEVKKIINFIKKSNRGII